MTKLESTVENSQKRDDGRESRAAVKLQKVYRSYRTRRRLADSAVIAEELWWQAINYARLNYSTVSFFDYHKPETAASRWSRISLIASKIGKGLGEDSKAQKLAFQHWIEAIDPRHRYGHNLNFYYEEWCRRDSGQPFFYWLDVGDGKEVNLKDCPRSRLKQECIRYLGPKKKGSFHHSSFLAGGATLAAGRLTAKCGNLKSVSAYSGHYRPTDTNLGSFLAFLKENGVNLEEVQVMATIDDDESSDINMSARKQSTFEHRQTFRLPSVHASKEKERTQSPSQSCLCNQTSRTSSYKRALSSNLQSPRTRLPKNEILQRIKSKKEASSYQLGRQLASKWSTGAGPRIGCVADYPLRLREQALEFNNLSPTEPLAAAAASGPSSSPTSFTSFCRIL